jgi:streptogramin lyase
VTAFTRLDHTRTARRVLAGAAAFAVLAVTVLVVLQLRPDRPAVPALRPVDEAAITTRTAVPNVRFVRAGLGSVWALGQFGPGGPDQANVVRIDPATGKVTARIGIGTGGDSLAIGTDAVWSLDVLGQLRRIDPATNRVTATYGTGEILYPETLTAAGDSLWVVGLNGTELLRIDQATGQVTQRVPHGTTSFGHHLGVGAGAVWVASDNDDPVSRVDVATGAATTIPATTDGGIVVDNDGVWLGGRQSTLVRYDPASGRVVATLKVGGLNSAVTSSAGSVWVADDAGNRLLRVDPAKGRAVAVLTLGQGGDRDLAAAGGAVWLAEGNEVLRIDPARF